MGPQPRPSGPVLAPEDPLAEEVRLFYEEHHDGIERARQARRYFYSYLTRILRTRIPAGQLCTISLSPAMASRLLP